MYEHLANFFGGSPNEFHLALYSIWSRYEWGMVITGNVQVSPSHLTLGRDLVVPKHLDEASIKPYKALANAIKGSGGRTLAILQLSHAGRQSPNTIGGRFPFAKPLAPSAIRVGTNLTLDDPIALMVHKILFQTPEEMSLADFDSVLEGFQRGARLAHMSGYEGIELHVAHGYLLTQFLSPKSNHRQDLYSLKHENGLHFLRRIVDTIRTEAPPRFVVGIKLNAADYVDTSSDDSSSTTPSGETLAFQHVLDIAKWGTVDFIDISGGDYESPGFLNSSMEAKTGRRQALFSRFSQQILKALDNAGYHSPHRPVIMLTGGLHTPNLVKSALLSGQTDIVGIGRASVVCPEIPQKMAEFEKGQGRVDGDIPFAIEPEQSVPIYLKYWPIVSIWASISKVKLVGAGLKTAWYTLVMRKYALTELYRQDGGITSLELTLEKPEPTIYPLWSLLQMYVWVADPKRPTAVYFALGFFVTLLAVLAYST
ncbi:hypothetical protein AGABI1DRAFT_93471 [Agaricus bisporus var. burnettii JB137-S8]|uniref:NADH:flavin oxidoreductase/NADH oxidase N-terminal domain-containing protein n=1 Tax=Agaricus bisporus var. burnettii (strain JB137-S8 / ATCC MYA-4627 / FGSC 10392) TaxID=597362 RepID=K5X2L8_AGABU|nr:uncharacterized protein AGABI1DRAFT_93471 [Agaricus bisporus var. burnettii JB137-S8]EKM77403.1 hypothetical protein AGABI1DRAFT_93471 [Agaricus bisporus var. burnettii JB137-S8]